MPDTREDKAVQDIEADIRRMAGTLRPLVAASGTSATPLPRTDDKVTVTHLRKALEQLTGEVGEAASTAWRQAAWLSGLEEGAVAPLSEGADGPIFETLARQIVEVNRQLARLRRAQEAIARALS